MMGQFGRGICSGYCQLERPQCTLTICIVLEVEMKLSLPGSLEGEMSLSFDCLDTEEFKGYRAQERIVRGKRGS